MLPNLPSSIQPALGQLSFWLRHELLVPATLAQAVCTALLIGLVLLVQTRLRHSLETWAGSTTAGISHQIVAAFISIAPWLLLAALILFASFAFAEEGYATDVLRLVESVALAWIVISLVSRLMRNQRLARLVAVVAWVVAVLNILHLIDPIAAVLDAMALDIGTLRISVLLLLKGTVVLCLLLWAANTIARVTEHRLEQFPEIAPAIRVLAAKLTRIVLLFLAVVLALGSIGIDLTAFAVFSGAVGVGVGFGLQKVVSNLVSGVILLLDRSIKPGDVIEVEGTYGWITKLNARYVSLNTRDGKEFLIPNEDLITQRVLNWSYTSSFVRLHIPVGISYQADPHLACELMLEAASRVSRVLKEPHAVGLLKGFGDSSIDLELRFWINDPSNGVSNVKSEVLFHIWDLFKEHEIEIPFPQRDVNLRNPEVLAQRLRQVISSPTREPIAEPHSASVPGSS